MTTGLFPVVAPDAAAPDASHKSPDLASRAPADPPASVEDTPDAPVPAALQALEIASEQIESYLRSVGRSLQFSVDQSTGRTVVSVRDAETGALIRQIPGEEALRLARLLDHQSGALIDLTA